MRSTRRRARASLHLVVTHAHSDHIAGAPAIRERRPSTRLSKMPWPIRDRDLAWTPLADGDVIETGEGPLQVVHTPGHAPDHICLWHVESRTLFVGDMLQQGTTVVIPASHGGSVSAYLASLDRLLRLNPARALPAHGPVIEDPPALIRYYVKHRAEREEQVLAALACRRRHRGRPPGANLSGAAARPRGVCARERACTLDQTGRRTARAAATTHAGGRYTERLHGTEGRSGRGSIPVPLRRRVSGHRPAADRARRSRATDPAARLRRLHDVAGAPEPRPGARVLEPERRARRDLGDRSGGVDLLRSVPRRRARDLADRSAVLRVEHSTGGGALRPARARPPALAVRHRPARPGVDRAVLGVRLHLLRGVDRGDRWPRRICTTTTSRSC